MMALLAEETLFPWTVDFLDNKGQEKTKQLCINKAVSMFGLD